MRAALQNSTFDFPPRKTIDGSESEVPFYAQRGRRFDSDPKAELY
jgi:hypothetical protein